MSNILSEKNSKKLLWFGLILFLTGTIIFLWEENFSINDSINSEKISQFGDAIGGIVGSIWSLAGVILFYVALTEQRKDIQINREALNTQIEALNKQIEEFELQRHELEETREVFKEQSETLRIQRFENTFFQLISLHHDLVDKLKFSKSGKSFERREMLIEACDDLNSAIFFENSTVGRNLYGEAIRKPNVAENKDEARSRIGAAYHNFYFKNYKQTLSHYFRNVYHIFKFIYKSDLIHNEKKQFYASLMRAQLSSEEQFLILYNSLMTDLGYPNFLFLIKEFEILQNFDFNLITKYPYHIEIFNEKIKDVRPIFK